jgi:hypothetical protein
MWRSPDDLALTENPFPKILHGFLIRDLRGRFTLMTMVILTQFNESLSLTFRMFGFPFTEKNSARRWKSKPTLFHSAHRTIDWKKFRTIKIKFSEEVVQIHWIWKAFRMFSAEIAAYTRPKLWLLPRVSLIEPSQTHMPKISSLTRGYMTPITPPHLGVLYLRWRTF